MASTVRRNNFKWMTAEWADWRRPDPKAVEEELKKEFTDEQRAEAWNKAAKAVKTHHDELVEQWQKAMDSVLVYAGLFSAVLTAFNVLSYPLLQPDPTDPMLAALQQISTQLNSFSINPSFINSTQPVRSPDQLQPPFRASASAVWINTLWFASLVFSLASTSIALMVKQWLYEESRGLSGTSRETARLRQYRLNSLIKWHVGAIVALFLFLAGLLALLWTIHETVAAVITTLVGALFVFVIIVTILPTFRSDCCYRSPQAFGMLLVVKPLWNGLRSLGLACFVSLYLATPRWRGRFLRRFEDLCNTCLSCIRKIPLVSTWNGAEQTEVARDNGLLDRHIATMAYTTTFATENLEALHILFSDLPCDQVFCCFSNIHRSWIDLWGPNDAVRRSKKLAEILFGKPLYCALRKVLTIDPDKRDSALGGDWTGLSSMYLLSSYDAANYIPLSVEFLSTLAHLSIGDSTLANKTFSLLYRRFYYSLDSESMPSAMNALRDVMAVAKYNITVANWAASRPRNIDMLGAVDVSLRFTRGYEMVPEEFLVIQMPREVSRDGSVGGYINSRFHGLKSVIRRQQHKEQHEHHCFRTQQPPAMVF
ncbi:hypothetical protein V8D89_002666 [Ganoderma adspersum]